MNVDQRIKELGLILPDCPKPVGSYHPLVISDGFAFLSGQLPKRADGSLYTGRVGSDLNLAAGQSAAMEAALNILSVLRHCLGFERLERIVRLVGYVQCTPDFDEIPQVINGASNLLLDVLGERGIHARSAVGMASLPLNAAVELECTVAVKS